MFFKVRTRFREDKLGFTESHSLYILRITTYFLMTASPTLAINFQ